MGNISESTFKNKHRLCYYLFTKWQSEAFKHVKGNLQFIFSGGFHHALEKHESTTFVVTTLGIMPYFSQTNHEESDTQIWTHVVDTASSVVHIRSIDSDIGMISLPLFQKFSNKHVYIEFQSAPILFIHLNKLVAGVENDDHLVCIPQENRTKVAQTVYIASGCDFVSYWVGLGKTRYFKAFFQCADFISGHRNPALYGCLSYTSEALREVDALAFYRLIGSLYFKENRACLRKFQTPSRF